MHLSDSAKLLRQRAVVVALLISAALAVAAITITALGKGSAAAHGASHSGLIATAAHDAVAVVELIFGGGHWG